MSGKKGRCECLRIKLGDLHDIVYKKAQSFFAKVGICSTCSGTCCHGDYNRFTVFDHIFHLVSGLKNLPEWKYRLYPLKSYALNRVDQGKCPCLIDGRGCRVDYIYRPTICIWWICDKMEALFDHEQKQYVNKFRQEIEKVHWEFVLVLLFGGMERTERAAKK